jgi:5-formyltetrahydrofolate cyclo-ligase
VITAEKAELRAKVKRLLAALSPEQLGARSRLACERLTSLRVFARAHIVMLYLPLPGELDCMPAIEETWRRGKLVAVPRVRWDTRVIEPVICESLQCLVEGRYGLREPVGPAVPLEAIEFVVAPGLAFDSRGGRLGRGGGFYDRFLCQKALWAMRCGLALSDQLVQRVPTETCDQRVDMLVTEDNVWEATE